MHHVPPHVVELFPRPGRIDPHREVATALRRTVAAENFAGLQRFSGHYGECGCFHCYRSKIQVPDVGWTLLSDCRSMGTRAPSTPD